MPYHIRCRIVGIVEVYIFHIEIGYFAKSCLDIKRIDRNIVEIDLVMLDHPPIHEREELLRRDEGDKHRRRIDPCMDE